MERNGIYWREMQCVFILQQLQTIEVSVVEDVKAYNHPASVMLLLVIVQVLYLGDCQGVSLLFSNETKSFGIVIHSIL